MLKFALYAHLKAKPEKAADVRGDAQVRGCHGPSRARHGYLVCVCRRRPDVRHLRHLRNRTSAQAHLDGPIAKALMSKADELLAQPPAIHKIRLIAAKAAAK